MKIHETPFMVTNSAFATNGKNAKLSSAHTDGAEKEAGANNQNVVVLQLSPKSQFDKMIEKIQEQIQKVQENEHYDDDTKKSKIEQLEKQLAELEKAKGDQTAESLLGQAKKTKNSNAGGDAGNNTIKTKTNSDGDTLEFAVNTKAIVQADNNLKNLQNAHSMKIRSEGEARVLASEIKTDKGREINTARKEERLAQINKTIEKSAANMGEAIRNANNAARGISENTDTTIAADNENSDGGELKSEQTASVNTVNMPTNKRRKRKNVICRNTTHQNVFPT